MQLPNFYSGQTMWSYNIIMHNKIIALFHTNACRGRQLTKYATYLSPQSAVTNGLPAAQNCKPKPPPCPPERRFHEYARAQFYIWIRASSDYNKLDYGFGLQVVGCYCRVRDPDDHALQCNLWMMIRLNFIRTIHRGGRWRIELQHSPQQLNGSTDSSCSTFLHLDGI